MCQPRELLLPLPFTELPKLLFLEVRPGHWHPQ